MKKLTKQIEPEDFIGKQLSDYEKLQTIDAFIQDLLKLREEVIEKIDPTEDFDLCFSCKFFNLRTRRCFKDIDDVEEYVSYCIHRKEDRGKFRRYLKGIIRKDED